MAKPCTLHPIPQAEQFFKIETANVGGRGGTPLAFSWGFKGAILSRERMAPLNPQENARGVPPRPPTLAVSILKNCSACGIGCSVHGFAMNPYFSSPLSTASYYREARVTFIWQQTACRMRHCWRSPHCWDWR